MAHKRIVQFYNKKFNVASNDWPQSIYQLPKEHQIELHLALSLKTPIKTVESLRAKMTQLHSSGFFSKLLHQFERRHSG